MGRIVYWQSVSLDGFTETLEKDISWTAPGDPLFRDIIDEARTLSMMIQGRRTYEMMAAVWPRMHESADASPLMKEYGPIWTRIPKLVFSRNDATPVAWNSRLVTHDLADEARKAKSAADGDIWLAGPHLAASFIELGLIDEFRLVLRPTVIGSGTRFFPEKRLDLRLLGDPRVFPGGAVILRYGVTGSV